MADCRGLAQDEDQPQPEQDCVLADEEEQRGTGGDGAGEVGDGVQHHQPEDRSGAATDRGVADTEAERSPHLGQHQGGTAAIQHRLLAPGGAKLTVTGRQQALPADTALTVYRVIQESLSNVRKHAPASSVEVTMAWSGQTLTVTVSNPAPEPSGEPGWGIAGMRERAALTGGTLDAGWSQGRFSLQLDVPLGDG